MRGLFVLASLVTWIGPAAAQQPSPIVDPHAVYEKSCNACHHEHAGDLARLKLKRDGERVLVSRTGKDVAGLLRNHHGVKLGQPETTSLVSLFRSAIDWGGVYQARCARCHERAAPFARSKLALDGDILKSRASGQDVAVFLQKHGDVTPDEIKILVDMLKTQLTTNAQK